MTRRLSFSYLDLDEWHNDLFLNWEYAVTDFVGYSADIRCCVPAFPNYDTAYEAVMHNRHIVAEWIRRPPPEIDFYDLLQGSLTFARARRQFDCIFR